MNIKLEHLIMIAGMAGSIGVSYFTFEGSVQKEIAVTNEMIRQNTERINQLNDLISSKLTASQELTEEQLKSLSDKINQLQTAIDRVSGDVLQTEGATFNLEKSWERHDPEGRRKRGE